MRGMVAIVVIISMLAIVVIISHGGHCVHGAFRKLYTSHGGHSAPYAHGVYRKLKISRIALRDMASSGKIPGLTKSSW